ncbi:MAG: S8 family serine peptidase [Sandaracinaceae bacterium]|nr:S8 family serine peptidase [Sandaracinaceae bacterium]
MARAPRRDGRRLAVRHLPPALHGADDLRDLARRRAARGTFFSPELGGPHADAREAITIPATASGLIAVAATLARTSVQTDRALTLDGAPGEHAPFSSIGPTPGGAPKPDLAAPGGFVLAALSRDVRDGDPDNLAGGAVARLRAIDGRVALRGTSAAAAVVAGALLLALELDPSRAPDARALLISSARGDGAWSPELGAGELDVPRLLSPRRARARRARARRLARRHARLRALGRGALGRRARARRALALDARAHRRRARAPRAALPRDGAGRAAAADRHGGIARRDRGRDRRSAHRSDRGARGDRARAQRGGARRGGCAASGGRGLASGWPASGWPASGWPAPGWLALLALAALRRRRQGAAAGSVLSRTTRNERT